MRFAEASALCCNVTDTSLANRLLERATRLIIDECGEDIDEESAADVCCQMVERAMAPIQSDFFGVTSSSMSAGGYQQTLNYYNSSGEIYLLDKERERLTGTSSVIGFASW